MGPTGSDNGWERWRGEIDARIDDTEDSVRALWKFKSESEREIAILKTKMVFFSAVAAAIGAMLPGAVAAFFK